MKPSITVLVLSGLVATLAGTAAAQELACPPANALVQVAACAPPEQLRQSFIGYCSDNRRMYERDADVCASFENYLRARNTARWESRDGAFEGYLSCEAGAAAAGPAAMSIGRQGAITVVACRYGPAATLNHRTRARCTLVDAAACAADAGACRARCE